MNIVRNDEEWFEIFEKLSNYKGPVTQFCKENGIKISTLYGKRKRLQKSTPIFHEIKINGNDEKIGVLENNFVDAKEIKIEVGKAKIYISNTDTETLNTVLKEIIRTC